MSWRMPALISATVSSSPLRYFSMRSSSDSATRSMSMWRYSSALACEVGGDLLDLVLGTHGHVTLGVTGPHQGTHLDEVDDTDEVVLGTDGQLDDQRLRAEAVLDVWTVK